VDQKHRTIEQQHAKSISQIAEKYKMYLFVSEMGRLV